MIVGRRALVAAAYLCACGADPSSSPPAASAAPLPPAVAARVGKLEISVESLARIAASQQVPSAHALDLAVRDALLASEARARGLDDTPEVRSEISAVLARHLLRVLLEEAASAGPVTDEELRAATRRHWLDLDRPEGFHTVHAVVRLKEDADAATHAKARGIADAIRTAVLPARDVALRTEPPSQAGKLPQTRADPAADAFLTAARSVAAEGLEVVAQSLPPVAVDGRTLTPEPQQFDLEFARAAGSLTERGDLTGLVTTSFGVHVIMLLARIPAQNVPEEERRRLVRDEVVSDRARAAQAQLASSLRREAKVLDGVDALLELVRIEP